MRHCRHRVEEELVVVGDENEAEIIAVVVEVADVDEVAAVVDVDEVAVLKVTSPPDSRKRDEMQ